MWRLDVELVSNLTKLSAAVVRAVCHWSPWQRVHLAELLQLLCRNSTAFWLFTQRVSGRAGGGGVGRWTAVAGRLPVAVERSLRPTVSNVKIYSHKIASYRIQRRIQDLGRRIFVRESGEWKYLLASRGKVLMGQVPQKLVIFCKLYYSDGIRKKSKTLFVNLTLYIVSKTTLMLHTIISTQVNRFW